MHLEKSFNVPWPYPEAFLTSVGVKQHQELGIQLRERYKNFIPFIYDPS